MELKNISKAIIAVMQQVKGIDKSMTVGSGSMSYKGVPDQEVKKVIGEAMAKNGLCLLPIGIETKTQVDRWEENNQYGQKQKQQVFTEAVTKYLLLHESGESIELSGYGHGVDSQDKSAGKATTYALKYTLLYTFLVPTGKIDDTDATHSDEHEAPKRQAQKPADVTMHNHAPAATNGKPLIPNAAFNEACKAVKEGKVTMKQIEAKYSLVEAQRQVLEGLFNQLQPA